MTLDELNQRLIKVDARYVRIGKTYSLPPWVASISEFFPAGTETGVVTMATRVRGAGSTPTEALLDALAKFEAVWKAGK